MAGEGGQEHPAAMPRSTSCEDAVAAETQWADAGERLRGVNISEKYLEQKERELQR